MNPVNVPAIGAYIREQREQARISLRQLAQATGVSNPYLSQIERGLRKPSADILQQLSKGLRISAEALYVQAGFLEDRPSGQGVREAVLTDPELTERQKQMLLEIYDSFRNEAALDAKDRDTAEPADAGLDPAALAWPELAGGPGGAARADPALEEAALEEAALQEEALEAAALQEVALEAAAMEEVILAQAAVVAQAAKELAAQEQAVQEQPAGEHAAQAPKGRGPGGAAPKTGAKRPARGRATKDQGPEGAGRQQPGPGGAAPKAGAKRPAPAWAANSQAPKKQAGPGKTPARKPVNKAPATQAGPDGTVPDGARPSRSANPTSGVGTGNGGRAGRARPSAARTR